LVLRLNLTCEKLISCFASNSNLRRYIVGPDVSFPLCISQKVTDAGGGGGLAGEDRGGCGGGSSGGGLGAGGRGIVRLSSTLTASVHRETVRSYLARLPPLAPAMLMGMV